MMIQLALGYGTMAIAITLGIFGWIPAWLASPLVIAGWAYANHTFWEYQAWRASGPRRLLINPIGPMGSDALTNVLWLSFGVFFHLYHVWLRSDFSQRRRRAREERNNA